MRFIAIIGVLCSATAIKLDSYPYQRVSPAKSAVVTAVGGNAEFEPLTTGSMKTLPNLNDLKKGLLVDGFKEAEPDCDSIEQRIKRASRDFGGEEEIKVTEKNAREAAALNYGINRGYETGVNWNPKQFGIVQPPYKGYA